MRVLHLKILSHRVNRSNSPAPHPTPLPTISAFPHSLYHCSGSLKLNCMVLAGCSAQCLCSIDLSCRGLCVNCDGMCLGTRCRTAKNQAHSAIILWWIIVLLIRPQHEKQVNWVSCCLSVWGQMGIYSCLGLFEWGQWKKNTVFP